jgi:ABC-type amino acid transport substrate-binding protein
MPVFAFILIGGIWAAFLLPSFIDGRRKTPSRTTRSFARSTALLASVSSSSSHELAMKRNAQVRRQRILIGLFAVALGALAIAVWQGSLLWLGVAVGFDIVIAAYVAMLLQMKARPAPAAVVPIGTPAPVAELVNPDEQRHTVRVVAS